MSLAGDASQHVRDEADFRRIARVKQWRRRDTPAIGGDLVDFFKRHVERRVNKFGKISDVWNALVPSTLLPHTCLETFHTGTLKVLVDSSPHLYELKTLLLAGLEKQILLSCRSHGLKKVAVRLGRWYEGEDSSRVKF